MGRRECPYCRAELNEQDAYYLLTWYGKEDILDDDELYKELKGFLEEFRPSSDQRKIQRFERVWKHYNYNNINELAFHPGDYILRPEEVRRLIEFITGQGKNSFSLSPVPFFRSGQETGNILLMDEPQKDIKGSASEQDEDTRTVYIFEKKNKQDEFDLQGDISVGIRDHVVAKLRRICSHCYNLIPDDLYHLPMVKVYLMATPGSGKTSMLYSIFLNKDQFHEKNQKRMEWESIQDITVDPYFQLFHEEMQKYKIKRKIDSTTIRFIPPLFLKVTYREEGKEYRLIVAFYDNGGEIFLDNENENAKAYGGLFNQKIKGMDALLCIVDPESTVLDNDKYGIRLSKEEMDKIREAGRILSLEKQDRIEDNPLEEEVTLETLLNNCRETVQGEGLKNSSTAIMENLQNRLGGEQEMKEAIKDKYFALVISKTDYMISSRMIQEDEKNLFFDNSLNYFSEEERQRKMERNRKMREWQRKGILVQYNLNNFREKNYHFIAAYIKWIDGIHPIRVEEPLIGIVMDFIRREDYRDGSLL